MLKKQKIPVIILAGGFGTRLSEETLLKPKPMVEIGEIPIIVHLMRWYYSFGFNDFVICAGYRSWDIKQYFLDYELRQSHLSIDRRKGECAVSAVAGIHSLEDWRVRVFDTGQNSMTGSRLAQALDFISSTDSFF